VVVNEAMASGLAVVVSDQVGASADLVSEGHNGFVVPVGDAAALSERLVEVLSSDERRLEMGRKSREMISHWDYAASVRGFVDAANCAMRRKGRKK